MDTSLQDRYDAASAALTAADQRLTPITLAYRAGEIGDDEYLVARARRDAIAAEYDAAYIAFAYAGEEN